MSDKMNIIDFTNIINKSNDKLQGIQIKIPLYEQLGPTGEIPPEPLTKEVEIAPLIKEGEEAPSTGEAQPCPPVTPQPQSINKDKSVILTSKEGNVIATIDEEDTVINSLHVT